MFGQGATLRVSTFAYRFEMSAPTDNDRIEASQRFFSGLIRGDDANQLVDELADLHVRNNTFPGEVFMELAAAAGADWQRRVEYAICFPLTCPKSSSKARSIGVSSTRCLQPSPFMVGSNQICSTKWPIGSSSTGSTRCTQRWPSSERALNYRELRSRRSRPTWPHATASTSAETPQTSHVVNGFHYSLAAVLDNLPCRDRGRER